MTRDSRPASPNRRRRICSPSFEHSNDSTHPSRRRADRGGRACDSGRGAKRRDRCRTGDRRHGPIRAAGRHGQTWQTAAGRLPKEATADANGRFVFAQVAPDQYVVSVGVDGFEPRRPELEHRLPRGIRTPSARVYSEPRVRFLTPGRSSPTLNRHVFLSARRHRPSVTHR